jgi:hypothetical protein
MGWRATAALGPSQTWRCSMLISACDPELACWGIGAVSAFDPMRTFSERMSINVLENAHEIGFRL